MTDPKTLPLRLGIDWGGTKMEVIALDASTGLERFRKRVPTPRDDYPGCIAAVRELVSAAEAETGLAGSVGLGIPGSLSPATGLVKNANSTWMNGKPLDKDLEEALARPVRIQNDANCLAVSEATDGAGAGAHVVHAIIIGTGCGSGIAIDGRAHRGANGIGGEWGNIPVPWMREDEYPGPDCWTGHRGTIDRLCSGTGFQWDHEQASGESLTGREIVARAREGCPVAAASLDRYISRLGRAMAMAANLIDPDVFVLGGGMSNVDELYTRLADAMAPFIFSDHYEVPIRKAAHGDSSGVRGAAWLWNT
jgi:fructokinase